MQHPRLRLPVLLRPFAIRVLWPLGAELCNAVSMKNKNQRELEKRWATEAAKKRKAAETARKSPTRPEDANQPAAAAVPKATGK